jgi:hypothetical protein
MSGPYPPPGYPRPPEQNGWWGGQPQGSRQGVPPGGRPPGPVHPTGGHGVPMPQFESPQYGAPPPGSPPPYETSQYDFPTVQYSGLATPPGGWGEPPRRRNRGRIIVAVVSVLVIVGGVATGLVLLDHRHGQQQTAASPAVAIPRPSTTVGGAQDNAGLTPETTEPADPGVPNGSTTLTLSAGECVTAEVVGNEQYKATHRVTCGTEHSDLVLATTTPDMTGCADHQYLRLSTPTTGVDCFTLDIRTGDCVDGSYLKSPCAGASFSVLKVEAGPGSASSCTTAVGATHWVPVGRDPVQVGCLGPPAKS